MLVLVLIDLSPHWFQISRGKSGERTQRHCTVVCSASRLSVGLLAREDMRMRVCCAKESPPIYEYWGR